MKLTLDQKDIERLIKKGVDELHDGGYRPPTVKVSGNTEDGSLTAVVEFERIERDPKTGKTLPREDGVS